MANEKKDLDEVGLQIEGPGICSRKPIEMPNLPKPLSLEEKKYLLAVERGDTANVRRILQRAHRRHNINVDCVDSLGRGALMLAIEGENFEMLELLVVLGVATKDALLHAINSEFVEAVELLLEHEEIIHKDGQPYSWQKVDHNTATFSPDLTPLILAAHRNNYEILKILLDRGATLPMPHDIKCGCDVCIRESEEDSLRHSMSRVNEYRALASPSLIALSSSDPILTAFQLSWELRNLAFAEQESKSDYMELRRQCQKFAVDLLHQSRSSQELAVILNHDPDNPPYEDGEHMKLARLELAINYKQKKFVAHPNIQQLLAAIWYDGLPGFRRKPLVQKMIEIVKIALLFPFYCTLYMIAPETKTGMLMRKPFMKFLIHASSYLFFLLILILVSQRAEVYVIKFFGTESMKIALEQELLRQRGNGPTFLECIVVVYVLGFIWEETMEMYIAGIRSYLRDMWNFIDFTRNSFYVGVFLLRCAAYIQQSQQIAADPSTAYIPREQWDSFDPQLIAEGAFAAANIFSALKLVHMFSINPHLGPLQISLGRMVIDIVKFFFIYSLVLFAFACGLNQLLWYFAELERRKCYSLPGDLPDWEHNGDSCTKWRSFGNLFESTQSLFWASFGALGLETFELTGIKTYTRFWGMLMFGSYSVINVIVLLNLLIAMMSNSYAMIEEHADTEWKFARTRLWMSYFEESATLPPPFNIFPTPKIIFKLMGIRKKDKLRRMSSKRKERQERERDYRYTAVMRALVWRYVSAMHRQADESPVTDDDINEVKGEISAMRYEILEVLERNGMDVSSAEKRKDSASVGRKMKIWERRLMKDFHLSPVNGEEEMETLLAPPPENEDLLSKFRRVARLAVLNSTQQKWGQVISGVVQASQIGRCNNRESFKNQQNLQRAMLEAKKLVARSPIPGSTRNFSPSPIHLPETTGQSIEDLLHDIKEETRGFATPTPEHAAKTPLGGMGSSSGGMFLAVQSANKTRQTTPSNTIKPVETAKHVQTKDPPKTIDKHQQKSEDENKPTKESIDTDPSPLKQHHRNCVPDEPPKVFKKKAPVPLQDEKPIPGVRTSRQVGTADIKTTEQPKSVAPMKLPETLITKPSPEVYPRQDVSIQITGKEPLRPPGHEGLPKPPGKDRPRSPGPEGPRPRGIVEKRPIKEEPKQHPQILPKFELSPAPNTTAAPVSFTSSTASATVPSVSFSSSTEQLLLGSSPEPLKPGKKIEDVNTIKRPTKAGWL